MPISPVPPNGTNQRSSSCGIRACSFQTENNFRHVIASSKTGEAETDQRYGFRDLAYTHSIRFSISLRSIREAVFMNVERYLCHFHAKKKGRSPFFNKAVRTRCSDKRRLRSAYLAIFISSIRFVAPSTYCITHNI